MPDIESLLKPLTWEERADMEWDGESNPGEDSVHYDTWLAKEEADANDRVYAAEDAAFTREFMGEG